MKDKGLLVKPSVVYNNQLPALPENKVTVSYEVKYFSDIRYASSYFISLQRN